MILVFFVHLCRGSVEGTSDAFESFLEVVKPFVASPIIESWNMKVGQKVKT